jgi:hypothetical protein
MQESSLTVAEVAELLKLNEQTVGNWIERGELPRCGSVRGGCASPIRYRSGDCKGLHGRKRRRMSPMPSARDARKVLMRNSCATASRRS